MEWGDIIAHSTSDNSTTSYEAPHSTQNFDGETQNKTVQFGDLRHVSEIPERYQHVFSEYPCFNAIQSRVMDELLYSDEPVVVAAPTGSGKTALFELAIIKLLENLRHTNYTGDFKIVYLAPVKALCSERLVDWQSKFSEVGLRCIEVTGDNEHRNLSSIQHYNLVLTTPEKWDSLTRKWTDHRQLVQVVKLFLIDEVHLLNEERRGPTLEAVVSRMKTVQENLSYQDRMSSIQVRFIAVSATIPNIEDIAMWLGPSHQVPAKYHQVGEEMRPVKLRKIVKGYTPRPEQTPFSFDMNLNYKLKQIISEYSNGKPTLIFCSSRKGVQQAANQLLQDISYRFTDEQKAMLHATAKELTDNKLAALVLHGIGFHHAGMINSDRLHVSQVFRTGCLPILVSTSTLAMGVNLPAHLVIIKSTEQYIQGGLYQEYTDGQLMQMMGRAGRPQFDSTATAVIMTKEKNKLQKSQANKLSPPPVVMPLPHQCQ